MAGYNVTRAFSDYHFRWIQLLLLYEIKQMTTEFVKNVSRILLAKYQENQIIIVCILI